MPTYLCNDGNAEVEITAETAQEAAQEYVDGGEWGEITETDWVTVRVTEAPSWETDEIVSLTLADDQDAPDGQKLIDQYVDGPAALAARVCSDCYVGHNPGATIDGQPYEYWVLCPMAHSEPDSVRIKIALEPDEPECEDGEDHDWQSPIEIVGGIKENPGVYGHGGGVTITTVCMHCGAERVVDTWAQDSSDGEQGLESVSYEPSKYADEVAALAE